MIVFNSFLPFKGYKCMAVFPFIFVRNGTMLYDADIQHEQIHFKQQKELLVIGFFLWYAAEWLIRLAKYRNAHKAYRNVSLEREAYEYEDSPAERASFGWLMFL